MSPAGALEVDGRSVRVSNLDKVLYPADGTTKHDVLAHYLSVAEVILPQLEDRPVTRKRWPDGVTGSTVFFEKNVPRGTPEWIRSVTLDSPGSTRDREQVTYPIIEDRAGLAWVANLAALELHVPQWKVGPRGGVHHPDRLVIDLDPGEPAGLDECARVALLVRERLAGLAHDPVPVTSGSKGMQLYAALNGSHSASAVRDGAKRLAQRLQEECPDLVVSDMKRAIRSGKVLLDWSQNSEAKTTIAPYSLRGRDRAFVATPRTWEEVEAGGLAQVHRTEIPARLDRYGDLMSVLIG